MSSSGEKPQGAGEPITLSHNMGDTPLPGRLTVMLSSEKSSPALMCLEATMLLRATIILGRSDGETCFSAVPIDNSILRI